MTQLDPQDVIGRGPYQGAEILGEITESVERWILDGWAGPDRLLVRSDLDYQPAERQRVVYLYMYRCTRNSALLNSKRWRPARVSLGAPEDDAPQFLERPPLYLDVFYLLSVHARFRPEAERLLGWLLLRLNEATHLIYRPRRYVLPDGEAVDATGRPWTPDNRGEGVIMEKVSLDIVDDLNVGDAVNFFNIQNAPYRPYVTYRARCAMEGSLVQAAPTFIRSLPVEPTPDGASEERRAARQEGRAETRPNGRMPTGSGGARSGRARLADPRRRRTPFGPDGHRHGPIPSDDSPDSGTQDVPSEHNPLTDSEDED